MRSYVRMAIGRAIIVLCAAALTPAQAVSAEAIRSIREFRLSGNALYLSQGESTGQTCELFDAGAGLSRRVGDGDVLFASVAVGPDAKDGAYRFSIVASDGARETTLFARILMKAGQGTGWENATVDVSSLAGRKIEFRFKSEYAPKQTGGWGPAAPADARWGGVRLSDFRRRASDMNVILISLDTLRADRLGCYGNPRDTSPNIDRLAAAGIRFDQAISQSGWTKPAHASLFTGLYPETHGVQGLGFVNRKTIESPTLAEALQRAGYVTEALVNGGYVSALWGFFKGFDRYYERRGYQNSAPHLFARAEEFVVRNKNNRFFLFLHTYELHSPYRHERFGTGVFDRYDSGIRFTDKFVGRLMDTLRDAGLFEDTMVILTSDHGEDLGTHVTGGTHGHSLFDELIRVPLIIHCPARFEPRVIENFQAQLIDVFPTVADALSLALPAPVEGRSFLPLLNGRRPPKKSYAMSESMLRGPEQKAIRYVSGKKKLKYIIAPRVAMPGSEIALKTSRLAVKGDGFHKWATRAVKKARGEALFDLSDDPAETQNLMSTQPAMAADLRRVLFDRLLRIAVDEETPSGQPGELDEALKEDLRSLGY